MNRQAIHPVGLDPGLNGVKEALASDNKKKLLAANFYNLTINAMGVQKAQIGNRGYTIKFGCKRGGYSDG